MGLCVSERMPHPQDAFCVPPITLILALLYFSSPKPANVTSRVPPAASAINWEDSASVSPMLWVDNVTSVSQALTDLDPTAAAPVLVPLRARSPKSATQKVGNADASRVLWDASVISVHQTSGASLTAVLVTVMGTQRNVIHTPEPVNNAEIIQQAAIVK
ncbi:hypothetical protein L345_13068, partial [Ophiophagus hannah]